jgi:hypothetical protein
MNEQAILELIKTLGDFCQNITERVKLIEQNGATKEDIKSLRSDLSRFDVLIKILTADGKLNHQSWLEHKEEATKDSIIISKWNNLWSAIFAAKNIGKYLFIISLSIFGGWVALFKLGPVVQAILKLLK